MFLMNINFSEVDTGDVGKMMELMVLMKDIEERKLLEKKRSDALKYGKRAPLPEASAPSMGFTSSTLSGVTF